MKVSETVDIQELKRMAKTRLPRIVFDWIEEGAGDEAALQGNVSSFLSYRFAPRYFRNVSDRTQETHLFEHLYASPFGFSPTGMQGLIRCGAERMMAEVANDENIPYVMSGLSTTQLEKVAKAAPRNMWYQPYPTSDRRIVEALIARAADAGISTLVITSDLPVEGKRLRSLRHRRRGRPNLAVYLDLLLHPRWTASYLWNQPHLEDLVPYAPAGASRKDLDKLFGTQYAVVREKQTWEELERYRKLWPGNLVVKGVLSPLDAIRASELGADGLVVSNHGGRQLERAPAPLEAFPYVQAAVGHRLPVMLDGGIRRGSDIVIALCLGAKFVFLGRAALYGLAAGGKSGITKVVEIIKSDIDAVMGQLGALTTDDLNREFLAPPNSEPAQPLIPDCRKSDYQSAADQVHGLMDSRGHRPPA